jgi:predicted ATPase/transcriptional regulator with XRE-family HTH domain/Tfp pilus assembly protein PilF
MNTQDAELPRTAPASHATFGELLRHFRLAAGLSQEELAERAGLSVQGLSALENGRRQTPYRHTVMLLANAMNLPAADAAALEAAIVRVRAPASVAASAPGGQDQEPTGDASPPGQALQPARTNLPVQPTSFVGRERDLGEVQALLSHAPLLTLTGAGGAGKTRLALAAAGELIGEYPDGVWLVELAALADPALVVQAVPTVLGLHEEPNRPLLATLIDHLKDRRLLLVLDNCEHLVESCAELATALLRSCLHLRILATSRETLAVPGETTYRIPSLAVPDLARLPDLEDMPAYAAVRLFVQRAQSRRPDFTLNAQNTRSVAEVCARLDGMPLAIELAAARVASLPVEAIAARLDDRFRLLTGGPRTVVPRQQTLRATLDWSYDLLGEGEQRLLARLSVFAGGWTLEAAERVCVGPGVEAWDVLDLLGGLLNKSLVLLEEREGDARYRLLETSRQYAHEQLTLSAGVAAARDRHLAWCMALAEEAAPRLTGSEQAAWLARLEAEHDNLRAALGWARERPAADLGLRLAGALGRFWYMRGYFGEGRRWLEAVLVESHQTPAAARALALNEAGTLAYLQGDHGRAVALYVEALALRRALGDTQGMAQSLNNLGNAADDQGDSRRAAALFEEALALCRELEDTWGIATLLGNLGVAAEREGDYGRAATLYEETLTLRRGLGDTWGIANSLGNLGLVVAWQGEYGRAVALCEESLALRRALGDPAGIAAVLDKLGMVATMQGDYGQAAALYGEGLALWRELGAQQEIAGSLSQLGIVACMQGDYRRTTQLEEALSIARDLGTKDVDADALEGLTWVAAMHRWSHRAARLGGAAEALRASLGVPLGPILRAGHDAAVQAMRAALGEEGFTAAWAAGQALPLEEAIALALGGHIDAAPGR